MGVRIHYQDPLCLVYSDIVSDNRQFMVGYIGVRVKSESDLGETIGTVLSFDWLSYNRSPSSVVGYSGAFGGF